ncbi:MAG: isoleucine--tRNA ligase [Piscirickettsiaceae bacterium]|nr:isoleucine--tRNA ligase [Piscirickettsiaceae bacterium]
MIDYRHTLNLPTTNFPMKAGLPNLEPSILKRWQDINLYQKMRNNAEDRPSFILHDGPIYANGDIHIGHAVNKIIKDIILKSKTLSGFDTPYVPGWDCHGLPIELNVEKKLGKPGAGMSAVEFRKACRIYAQKYVDRQRDDFKRLGVLAEWDNPYLTMDFSCEADIIRTLGKIIECGHLYKGVKPVHWCIDCSSSLAEAEVEYENIISPSIDVRFVVIDDDSFIKACNGSGHGAISVPIWTTTPWTLSANRAVSLNPIYDYVLVQCSDERLLLAASLYESALKRYDFAGEVVARCTGDMLEGLLLQHPFYNRQVPIILNNNVTVESGTGAVHTAPGHGQDDFLIGLKYQLQVDNLVASNGRFLPDTEFFAGQLVFESNSCVISLLRERSVLLNYADIQHSYPHCWRHKSPIIFRATPQWFVGMDQNGLRQDAMKTIAKIKWISDWGQKRIENMVEGRSDWCISRQRTWGVPIPLFVHRRTGSLHPNSLLLIDAIAQQVEQYGIDAWFESKTADWIGEEAIEYEMVSDTLDVWFDSGVSHACVLDRRNYLDSTADLYFEGIDQYRGWFQSSLLTSIGSTGRAPYKSVMAHGFVVDSVGKKMSKSLGNVVTPQVVVDNLGADIIRLWVSSSDYSTDMSVSEETLKRAADSYRRIRNTARYLLSNLSDFNPAINLVNNENMLALDKWAVDRAYACQQNIISAYDKYHFHTVFQQIYNFCSQEMGSLYLDITKDRQYTMQKNSVGRRSTQTAMYHILEALTRWISPILSFTADELWGYLPGDRNESVLLNIWYEKLTPLSGNEILDLTFWNQIFEVRDAVLKELEILRSDGMVKGSLTAEVDIYAEPELFRQLHKLGDELKFILITSSANVLSVVDRTANVIMTAVPGLSFVLSASIHNRCTRCWYQNAEVGQNNAYPELCGRCINNIYGNGECRLFA